jgi:hypothetical protein
MMGWKEGWMAGGWKMRADGRGWFRRIGRDRARQDSWTERRVGADGKTGERCRVRKDRQECTGWVDG